MSDASSLPPAAAPAPACPEEVVRGAPQADLLAEQLAYRFHLAGDHPGARALQRIVLQYRRQQAAEAAHG